MTDLNKNKYDISGDELRAQLKQMEKQAKITSKRNKRLIKFEDDSFFNFSEFWTIDIIKTIYFLVFVLLNVALIISLIMVLFRVGAAASYAIPIYFHNTFVSILLNIAGFLLVAVLINLFWRYICESLMLKFRIYEVLSNIEQKLDK